MSFWTFRTYELGSPEEGDDRTVSIDDFPITSAAAHFAASKNADYRARVLQRYRAFVDFLQENDLVTRQLLSHEQQVTESFQIRKSDLTEIGFEVVKAGYDKWLKAHDKGLDISDVTILKKALAKVKERMES